MNLPRGIRSPIRSEGARLTKSVVSKAPLMKRREEDEASTAKTPRRHRSDEEEQEIERRALTTPHRTDKRSRRLSNELSPHPHRTDKRKRQRRKSRDATAPMKRSRRSSDKLSPHPHRTDPPLQSEDSHAKTPSPREDAKNVVYPTEELKDAADTPLMSQWRKGRNSSSGWREEFPIPSRVPRSSSPPAEQRRTRRSIEPQRAPSYPADCFPGDTGSASHDEP